MMIKSITFYSKFAAYLPGPFVHVDTVFLKRLPIQINAGLEQYAIGMGRGIPGNTANADALRANSELHAAKDPLVLNYAACEASNPRVKSL